MQELERIGCHKTAMAMWNYYKEVTNGVQRKKETS